MTVVDSIILMFACIIMALLATLIMACDYSNENEMLSEEDEDNTYIGDEEDGKSVEVEGDSVMRETSQDGMIEGESIVSSKRTRMIRTLKMKKITNQ